MALGCLETQHFPLCLWDLEGLATQACQLSLQAQGIRDHLWALLSLELLGGPDFQGVLGGQMQGLLRFLSAHSFHGTQEVLGVQQARNLFHLQNPDLLCHHESQVDLVFLVFLVGLVGLLVHLNTSAQEYLGDLEIPSDLEVHQSLEGLAFRGMLHYKE